MAMVSVMFNSLGRNVGIRTPVHYPVESDDLFTSGWSFGTFSTGQSYVYSVDGIHVPPEFFWGRIDNGAGDLGLNLLFFSAAVSAPRFSHYSVSSKYGLEDFGSDGTAFTQAWTRTFETHGTFIRNFLIHDSWSLINLISVQIQPQLPTDGGDSGDSDEDERPGFKKDRLKVINKALEKGRKLLKNQKCLDELSKAGIDVNFLIKRFDSLKPRSDTDSTSRGFNIFDAEKSANQKVQAFLQTERGKGAGAFVLGQDVFVRSSFFNARGVARIGPTESRALALIHEAIHLTGKSDKDFGGSSKLNELVIKSCFSKSYGYNDLAIVGN